MAGVDLGYDTDGLRQGGREALGAGQVASGAAGILRGATCPASALGVVAGAEALAAALARSRDAHVALAEQVHADHVDLDARAGGAAGAGDGLTASSASVARTGAPR
jgi:phosphohistidine swiveling domain-containing protein